MTDAVSAGEAAIYEPLNDPHGTIRLLKLEAPAANEQISVRLHQVSISRKLHNRKELSTDSSYVAVSYTWGPESPKFPIFVDGRRLLVRENIYRFLVHVQKTGLTTAPLWIDSICINQADKAEKGPQVQMMGQIFSQAEQVLVWLGAMSESGTIATYFAEYTIDSTSHPPPDDSALSDSEWSEESTSIAEACGNDDTRDEGTRWSDFLEDIRGESPTSGMSAELRSSLYREVINIWMNPYWKRLWIVQEIVLARAARIILGDRSINARQFCDIGGFWEDDVLRRDKTHHTAEWFPYLMQAMDRTKAGRLSARIGDLLFDHRLQLCADPRDRIYGLQSLMKPKYRLRVDYNMSIEELFVQLLHNVQKFISVNHKGLEEARLIMTSLNITVENLAEIVIKGDPGAELVKALTKTDIPVQVSVTNYVTETASCPQCKVNPRRCSDQYTSLNPSEWYTNWAHFSLWDKTSRTRTLAAIPEKGDLVMWCVMEAYVAFLVRIRGWEVVTVESHVRDEQTDGWMLYPAWHLSTVFGDRINDILFEMGSSWLERHFSEYVDGRLQIKLSPMEFVDFVYLGFREPCCRREE